MHFIYISFLFFLFFTSFCDANQQTFFSQEEVYNLYQEGIFHLTKKAYSEECKIKIEQEYLQYWLANMHEEPLPFENILFYSECPSAPLSKMPITKNPIQMPNENSSEKIKIEDLVKPTIDNLSITYLILAHENPDFTLRLIRSLNEPMHNFVIHIDKKAEDTSLYMKNWLDLNPSENLFLVPDSLRETLVWGGYSIVQATLNAMNYTKELNLSFDYLILLSGSTYPIKSNFFIRKLLVKQFPSVYMDLNPRVHVPEPSLWYHYVECDQALHRIARLAVIRGINMYLGSQWFGFPKYLFDWFLSSSLVRNYQDYAQHLVVADENFFNTMFMNSPYCQSPRQANLNFLFFESFAAFNDSSQPLYDPKRCLNIDQSHCGRSPTVLTIDFFNLIAKSNSLFARKFDPKNSQSMLLLDKIDLMRWGNSSLWDEGITSDQQNVSWVKVQIAQTIKFPNSKDISLPFDQTGWLINSSNEIEMEFCMEVQSNYQIKMKLCNENQTNQWFEIIESNEPSLIKLNQTMNNQEQCLDIAGENTRENTPLIVYHCIGKWNQLFYFQEDGKIAVTQPQIIGKIRGQDEEIILCLETNIRGQVITKNCNHTNIQEKQYFHLKYHQSLSQEQSYYSQEYFVDVNVRD